MITEQQINELLEAAKPSIIEGFKTEIKHSITWEVKNKAAQLVADATEVWIKENVIPEIVKELSESKSGLIAIGAKLGPAMVEVLTQNLIAAVSEKMGKSWERNKIFEAMFK